MRLCDVLYLIDQGCKSDDDHLSRHAATLKGPRTRGSTTAKGLEDFDGNLVLSMVKHPAVDDDCFVYTITLPGISGRIEAMPFGEVYKSQEIKVRDGEHGPELFVDAPNDGNGKPCETIYIILGKHEGETTVLTWHPGEPLAPFDNVITLHTAVKLHNG